MRTDRALTRPSSDRVAMRPIVDRQTPVKTLPSLAVGNNSTLRGNSFHSMAEFCAPKWSLFHEEDSQTNQIKF